MFQSSSLPKKGCNVAGFVDESTLRSFNPHPSRRRDATSIMMRFYAIFQFQSSSLPKKGCNKGRADIIFDTEFQSSSLPKKGCNLKPCDTFILELVFQSSSLPKKGCNPAADREGAHWYSFNPHPSRRRDATFYYFADFRRCVVSILIPPEEGMQPAKVEVQLDFSVVSILIPPEEGMQRLTTKMFCRTLLFQSSSLPKKGCN